MLIRSDLIPLPFGGRYRVTGEQNTMDAGAALRAIAAGRPMEPADEQSAELVSNRLLRRGNEVRAAMILRACGFLIPASYRGERFDVVVPEAADETLLGSPEASSDEPSSAPADDTSPRGLSDEPSPGAGGDASPDPGADEASARATSDAVEGSEGGSPESEVPDPVVPESKLKELVEEAGDDTRKLAALADLVGLPRQGLPRSADRLRARIFAAAAKRVAEGLPELIR